MSNTKKTNSTDNKNTNSTTTKNQEKEDRYTASERAADFKKYAELRKKK